MHSHVACIEVYYLGCILPAPVSFQTQTFTNLSSTRLWDGESVYLEDAPDP